MRFFVDCETTGLDPGYNEMVSLAFVDVHGESKEFFFRITDVNAVSQQALDVNGYSIDELLELPEREGAIQDLLCWLEYNKKMFGKIKPVGHNYAFDCAFVKATIGQKVYNDFFDYHFMDTMVLSQLHDDLCLLRGHPVLFGKHNLKRLCEVLGVTNDKAHTASSDALATREVHSKLLELFK